MISQGPEIELENSKVLFSMTVLFFIFINLVLDTCLSEETFLHTIWCLDICLLFILSAGTSDALPVVNLPDEKNFEMTNFSSYRLLDPIGWIKNKMWTNITWNPTSIRSYQCKVLS